MIQAALGIIDKMRIEVYETSDYKKTPKKTIFVQLNPEKYIRRNNVVFSEEQPIGASSGNLGFNKIDGEEVTFDFVFDSSGVVPPGKIKDGKGEMSLLDKAGDVLGALSPAIVNSFTEVKSVEEDVEAFKNLTIGYNGDTHQTAYLQILWGGFKLQCRLKSMDIEYTLFRKDGRPIRAKVKCVFKATTTHQIMVAQQNKTSPDLTHFRTVTMNDKLPLMAENIYENASYYIDVAQTNQLLSFRKIETGQNISFPPIK
ncbi:CIS tube protein [Chryseobacterium mucoviscidosis]|uniref:Contractile injection system tube protein N-terminal domain-containing protein n=1 Tax=Chryseobacterium mucoviscidosis TaxID=1945581 RepID=A0A202C7I7_9FLAO|nr:hypothetical protein [Chryseobacterium mucoviscidosis]OVE59691.1 hypothetical protein B0E34_05135 [Chryseobacterium mucoviscidosis]